MFGSFLRALWWLALPKFTRRLGADIVMESLKFIDLRLVEQCLSRKALQIEPFQGGRKVVEYADFRRIILEFR